MDTTLIYSVSTNSIKNNPLTKRDIEIYNEILGCSRYALKGKTTIYSSELIDSNSQLITVLETIKLYYGNIQLAANILNMNNIPFLTFLIFTMVLLMLLMM